MGPLKTNVRRFFAVLLCLSSFTPVDPANGSGKCTRINATKTVTGVRYVCAVKGKSLVWAKKPNASKRSATQTTVLPASDFLSFKNPMIYGVSDAQLTRKSEAGTYFETDSRKLDVFSTTRRRAYAELNPSSVQSTHPNVEFVYDVRPSFPAVLVDYTKRELSAAAALWNDFFQSKIRVRVSLVTEKDRDYIRSDRWLQLNLPSSFDRFEARNERPFITGGGGYWDRDGEWTGNIYLGTASYVDLTFIGYQWPQVARHEFFHVVQDYAMFRTGRARPNSQSEYNKLQPNHFREGGADAIGYLTSFRHIGWSSDAMNWNLWSRRRAGDAWIKVQTAEDAVRMMTATEANEPSQAFEMGYAIGSVMYEWLIGTYGLDGFKNLLSQLASAPSFDSALQNSVGITQNEFYARSAPYVLSAFRSTD